MLKLDNQTGRVVEIENEPKTGSYRILNGSVVKVSDEVSFPKQMVYGWKETDCGMYDKTFNCRVESKDHYRTLLKEHGCRQKENYNYCKTPKQIFKEKVAETRPVLEKAYFGALQKLSPSEREEI